MRKHLFNRALPSLRPSLTCSLIHTCINLLVATETYRKSITEKKGRKSEREIKRERERE